MIWHAVTTCNEAQWTSYGRAMAATFDRLWPPEIPLTVYAEGFQGETHGRIHFADLANAAPWLEPWKAARTLEQRGIKPDGSHTFKLDAVRFSHKIAAIGAAAEEQCDVLIWMDADTVTHAPVTVGWLESLFPSHTQIAWLDRERYYPECGFLMFRLPEAAPVIAEILRMYQSGEIFALPQTHDSFVIQHVVDRFVARGEIKVSSLSGEGRKYHHCAPNSLISHCVDHLKGKRKALGRTPKHERQVPGGGAYWR
jgi:hypothetical protein